MLLQDSLQYRCAKRLLAHLYPVPLVPISPGDHTRDAKASVGIECTRHVGVGHTCALCSKLLTACCAIQKKNHRVHNYAGGHGHTGHGVIYPPRTTTVLFSVLLALVYPSSWQILPKPDHWTQPQSVTCCLIKIGDELRGSAAAASSAPAPWYE